MSTIRIQYANGTQLFLDGKNPPPLDPLPSFNPSVEDLEGLDREKNTGKGGPSSAGIPVPPVNVDSNVDNGGAIPAPVSTEAPAAPAAESTKEVAQEAPATGQGDEKEAEPAPTTAQEEKAEETAAPAAEEATPTPAEVTARKTTSK